MPTAPQDTPRDPWNWNIYLFPLWVLGVLTRYLVLFPLRVLLLFLGWCVFVVSFALVHTAMPAGPRRQDVEARLIRFLCNCFVASWNGVIKFHGPAPTQRENHVRLWEHLFLSSRPLQPYIISASLPTFLCVHSLSLKLSSVSHAPSLNRRSGWPTTRA